ncbi:MAG TPA: TRAP transporter small permease subunit [Xanthobacteraceae bacterium]|jgi:TRAP-type mannitol/chloroaromatic compound transport system permease small subunit|nr:TRAP transporter small permease subunit [Xanthobacteraceae bacterium]
MGLLLKFSGIIDAINRRVGTWFALLVLVAVLVSSGNAIVRKIFDLSSNAWLELQWVLFSAVFLLCAPWTLLSNEHVRIDIVNGMLPGRARNAIDLIGHVFFLLPLTIIMIVTSIPFFLRSIRLNEQSFSSGGLPQWPAKSLIVIGFTLLAAQCISEIVKRIAVMRGVIPDPYMERRSALEAEVAQVVEAVEKR